jgi:hypothetical protein
MRTIKLIYRIFYTLIAFCFLAGFSYGCAGNGRQILKSEPTDLIFLKVYTLEDGFYEVSLDEMKKAGLEIRKSDLGDYAILQRGSPVNYWIVDRDKETTIRFYAAPSDSRYSKETITIITRKENINPDIDKTTDIVPALEFDIPLKSSKPGCYQEYKFEQNETYQPKALPGEPWLWLPITSPGEIDIPFDIELNTIGDARIQLKIWALTEAGITPDHRIVIIVNGEDIGAHEWDGKGWEVIDAWTPSGILKKGKNSITLKSPGMDGVFADKVVLDWIKIDLPVIPGMLLDQGKIRCYENMVLPKESLSTLDVYTHLPGEETKQIHASGELSADVGLQIGQEYWIVHDKSYRKPEKITIASTPDFRDNIIQPAEYLVIGESELLDAAKLLVEWRKSQGLSVTVLPVNYLYDYFNDGYPEPAAIRTFINWASTHWPLLPQYILLLGDATYDPKGYQSDGTTNRLPAFLIETQFGGETASDFGYSMVSADSWPDGANKNENTPQIAIGRFPAQSQEQVRIIGNKIIAYEKEIERQENRESSVLIVADNQETSFRLEGKNFLQELPQSARKILFSPEPGSTQSTMDVLDLWREGYQWIIYFGHGSIHQWGIEQYLHTDQVVNIPRQSRPPIILQFTCLSGLFTHPEVDSLSETLLWKPDGGAIALLAPTSLTLPGDQSFLSQEIAKQLNLPENHRLGDLLLKTWQETSALPLDINDVLRTFVLLGDPGMILP